MNSLQVNRRRSVAVILLMSAVIVCISPLVGVVNIWTPRTSTANIASEIFWSLRLPRILLAFCCGSALGLGGLVFQTMLRNPLATPYTLGVASGASCGAVVVILFAPAASFFGLSVSILGGLAGAGVTAALVYLLGSVSGALSMSTLLLAGVAVSFFFSSLILLFQYLASPAEIYLVVRWLMGGLETVGYRDVLLTAVFSLVLFAAALRFVRELDSMAIDDDLAHSWGVPVLSVQRWLFALTSISIGGVVSVTGPIGFIGIMLPHVCRSLVGPKMIWLLPSTAAASGAFLVLCDAAARTIAAPAEVPVGIITAMLGGPFFISVLLKRK